MDFEGIVGYPNIILSEVRDKLPKLNGMKYELAKMHFKRFGNLMDDHEDMVMRLFVQSLRYYVGD